MKQRPRAWIIALAVLVLAVAYSSYRIGQVLADGVPATSPLYYSGTIEENGTLVEGTRNVRLTVWDDGSSSDSTHIKCTTLGSGVPVQRGQFRLALDSACANVVRSTSELWVEVEVQGTSLGRSKIGAVPYAIEAGRASEATGSLAAQVAAGATPPGSIISFFGNTAPPGWLVADGSVISRATHPEYAALVEHLRSLGGANQGPTASDAVLPDLRALFLRGKNGLRADSYADPNGDQAVGTTEADTFASHAHGATTGTAGQHSHSGTTGGGTPHNHSFAGAVNAGNGNPNPAAYPAAGSEWPQTSNYTSEESSHTHSFSTSAAGEHTHTITAAGGSETRPKSAIVLYIIKY